MKSADQEREKAIVEAEGYRANRVSKHEAKRTRS
jgi:hypothetical protein